MPLHKRSKSFNVRLSTGCYVDGPDVAPPSGLSFDFCPCQPGLTCVSSGVRTVPLGEEGRPKSSSTHLFYPVKKPKKTPATTTN